MFLSRPELFVRLGFLGIKLGLALLTPNGTLATKSHIFNRKLASFLRRVLQYDLKARPKQSIALKRETTKCGLVGSQVSLPDLEPNDPLSRLQECCRSS